MLDGVAPPHLLIVPLEDARGAQTSVERLIAACRDDAACHQHFPSLAEHFAAVVARFDAGPVMVPLRRGSQTIEVALSKEVFADRLRQLLYSPQGAAYAPLIIEAAYRGDRAPLATMVDTVTNGLAEILALGLNLSVTCAEDIPFITAADVARTSAGSFEGDLRIRAQQRACAIWNVDPVPASYDEPVRSEAPILMISGSDDPATPPQYARERSPIFQTRAFCSFVTVRMERKRRAASVSSSPSSEPGARAVSISLAARAPFTGRRLRRRWRTSAIRR